MPARRRQPAPQAPQQRNPGPTRPNHPLHRRQAYRPTHPQARSRQGSAAACRLIPQPRPHSPKRRGDETRSPRTRSVPYRRMRAVSRKRGPQRGRTVRHVLRGMPGRLRPEVRLPGSAPRSRARSCTPRPLFEWLRCRACTGSPACWLRTTSNFERMRRRQARWRLLTSVRCGW